MKNENTMLNLLFFRMVLQQGAKQTLKNTMFFFFCNFSCSKKIEQKNGNHWKTIRCLMIFKTVSSKQLKSHLFFKLFFWQEMQQIIQIMMPQFLRVSCFMCLCSKTLSRHIQTRKTLFSTQMLKKAFVFQWFYLKFDELCHESHKKTIGFSKIF